METKTNANFNFYRKEGRRAFFRLCSLTVPTVGSEVSYEFRPTNEAEWAIEALEAHRKINGGIWRVKHVEHRYILLNPLEDAIEVVFIYV